MRMVQNNRSAMLKSLAVLSLLELLFLLYAVFRGKSMAYLQIAAVVIPFSLLAFVAAEKISGNKYLIIWTTILINCGFMVQAMTTAAGTLGSSLVKCIIAMITAFAAGFLFYYLAPRVASDGGMLLLMIVHLVMGAGMVCFGTMVGSEESQGAVVNLAMGFIQVQPFEVMKLTYILVMASLMSKDDCRKKKILGVRRERAAGLFTLMTAGIMIVCRELGTLLIVLASGGVMYLVYSGRKIRMKRLFLAVGSVISAAGVMILLLYRQIPLLDKIYVRFACMLNPEQAANTGGYQYLQMKKAIAVGGLFGPDTTRYITALTNEANDLIFCKLIQTCGVAMGIFVIAAFLFLVLEGGKIARSQAYSYYEGCGQGMTCLIMFQSMVHIGYSVGVFPITGIPLYFMSSGFTSLTIGLVMVAFLVVISTGRLETPFGCTIMAKGYEIESEYEVQTRSHHLKRIEVLVFLILAGALFWNSGIVKGLNPKADAYREQAIVQADSMTIAPGDIYDREGTALVKTEKAGESGVYADDFAYTQVLGYTTPNLTYYKDGEFTEYQNDYRLMDYYGDLLYQTTDVDGTKGASLTLTLDHELQMEVAALLAEEVGRNARGSAVVLDVKTGEILSMVSYPTFNANDLEGSFTELQSVSEELEMYYPITHKGYEVPGSIFKLVTAVSLIDHGLEDLTVTDEDGIHKEVMVSNAYQSPGDVITYEEAIKRSSNVFFAEAALELGGKSLEETAKKFLIGEELELDFGTVRSYWALDTVDKAEIAATAYGQGRTLLSTMYAAMIAQTIANDGIMMEPHLLLLAQDEKGTVLKEGETAVLSEVTSKETADKITEAMLAATKAHLHVVEGDENRRIYEQYEIASKTGTGETGEKDLNNAWFVSFAPASDPKYVVVVNQCDTEKYGQNLMDTAAGIYQYLFEGKAAD